LDRVLKLCAHVAGFPITSITVEGYQLSLLKILLRVLQIFGCSVLCNKETTLPVS